MSRIPAPGAIVGTTTVSAVLALCLLGGVGATAPAAADEATTVPSTIGASLIASENTASEVGLTPTTSVTTASVLSGVMTNAVMTANTASAVDTATSESAGTAASIDTMQTLGLAGGVASEQIPAEAMLSRNASAAVAAPATLAKVAAPKPAPAAITGTPLQVAHTIATQAGLNQQQWVCLDSLWYQESKFQTNAHNRRSGAFGIPQALPASRMASAGADWRTNPATQIKWGLSYIKVRYGTACNAWAHWKRNRWY
jgi:hypothetical protein